MSLASIASLAQTHRHKHTQTQIHTGTQITDIQIIDTQTQLHTGTKTHIYKYTNTHWHTYNRHTDNRHTDNRHTYTHLPIHVQVNF